MTQLRIGRLRRLARLVLIATLLSACQQGGDAGSGPASPSGYGGITATIVWPGQTGQTALNTPMVAPAGVTTVVLKVSGADMTTVSASFSAAAGTGSVPLVPVGSNRTLAVEGRNSANTLTFLGAAAPLTITSGATTNAGTIVMGDVTTFLPPDNVTGLTATGGDGQVTLAWTLAPDTSTKHTRAVMVRRDTVPFAAFSGAPTQGTLVSDGYGTGTTVTGLTNGTLYYFAVYAHDMVPNYASGAAASATPIAAGSACVWDTSKWDACAWGP